MLFQISNLLNRPVQALETRSRIGVISDVIVEPAKGQILGFWVKTGVLEKDKVLSLKDVREIGADFVACKNESSLVGPDEIIRIKEILNQKIKALNADAKTQSGKLLGKVEDLLVDSISLQIVKYYIKGLCVTRKLPFACLEPNRIIPANKVLKITPEAIIIKDEVGQMTEKELKEKVKAVVEPA